MKGNRKVYRVKTVWIIFGIALAIIGAAFTDGIFACVFAILAIALLCVVGYRTLSGSISDVDSEDPKKRTSGYAMLSLMAWVSGTVARNDKMQNYNIGENGIAIKKDYQDKESDEIEMKLH